MHDQQVTVTGRPASGDRRRRRVWVSVLVVAGVVIAVGVALLIGRTGGQGPGPEAGADDPGGGKEDPPTAGADPAADATLTVGDTTRLPDGAVARINGLEPDVTLDPGMPGPEPGMRLDRVDVEVCAGSTQLFVDAAFWLPLGDDGRVYSAHMGVRDLVTLAMAPGSCQRGTVDLALPEAVDLEAVLLADTEHTTLARWSVVDSPRTTVEPPSPLASETTPIRAAIGSPLTPSTGGSVTLHDVVLDATSDAAATAEPGRTIVRIDAERCAAQQQPASPRDWFVQLADHRLVAPEREGATMQTRDLDPQECDRGTADFLVPDDTAVAAVVYTYAGMYEEVRWVVGP